MTAEQAPHREAAARTTSRWPQVLPRGFVVLVGAAAATIVAAGVHATAWLIGPAFLALVIVSSAGVCAGNER